MTDRNRTTILAKNTGSTGQIAEKLQKVSQACIDCDLCQKECAFLGKYGTPKAIADRYDPLKREHQGIPFECSLCGLCAAVCPHGVDPAGLFLEMRREAVRQGGGIFPEHAALGRYEKLGASRRYSYYGFPEACDTVFFPGCTLSGTRSGKVILAYRLLKEKIPSLGIVLDCCMMPSHDLGRQDHFAAMFDEMRGYLLEHGIGRVIVACPNCYRMFARYGAGLSAKTVYEILAGSDIRGVGLNMDKVTIHDSCAVRFDEEIHEAVRRLIRGKGFAIEEMAHAGKRTFCCGEGGAVGFIAPSFAANWAGLRHGEAAGRKVVTYCAGCATRLGQITPTVHVLDILREGEAHGTGRAKVTKPPFTYWKRLRLKKWFKEHVPAVVARERTFTGEEQSGKRGVESFLPIVLISLLPMFYGRHKSERGGEDPLRGG